MAIKEKPVQCLPPQDDSQNVFAKDEDVRRILKKLRKEYANTLRELAK